MLPISAAETDSALIARLFEKLKGSMFDLVAQDINRANPTFLAACSMVQSTITLARQRAPTIQRSLQSQDSVMSSSSSYQVNASTSFNDVNPCWNCKGYPQMIRHSRDACQALHCRNCNVMWRTPADPTYHRFFECPIKALEIQQRGNAAMQSRNSNSRGDRHVPAQQKKRGSSPSRFQDRNTKQKTVAFQVQTMATSQQQQDYEEELISKRLAVNTMSSAADENVYEYESEDDEYDIYACNMMSVTTVDANVATRIAEARMVLQDSGANICVTPFAILEALPDLELFMWPKPKRVIFGNGTTAVSKYFVLLGPILHKTALLSCVINTILAVQPVNRRGYNINFTYQQRCIVTLRDDPQPIIDEPVHPSRHLYYVDIKKFVEYVNVTRDNM
jgi:hypothetical protein